MKTDMRKILESKAMLTFIAILIAFVVGAVVLVIAGINPFVAYATLLRSIFGAPKYLAWSVVYATPLIFTGLSVAFSFRTGVFNIGAEGQFVVGTLAAACVGILVDLPAVLEIPLCLIAAVAAGAVWGIIVGYLKVKWGINEVLSMIMFNWIAYYLSNYMVNLPILHKEGGGEATKDIVDSAKIVFPKVITQALCPRTNAGIIFAVIAVIVIYLIIEKTTLGYKLKAVGFKRHAAEYAGIHVNKAIMTAMSISGALAGMAGALQLMGNSFRVPQFAGQEGYGFEGITVALIGASNPIGVFFAGLFYGAMKYGSMKLSIIDAPAEIVDIIMGTIVFCIAISHVFRITLKKKKTDKEESK
ncbi:MAG: ABC transporter permease [Lachnospiraceae bacterium]|nr:ABC transporter permease [Lachnospiraceae bacterium]